LSDITLADKLFGWQPEVSLEEGIEELKNISCFNGGGKKYCGR